MTQSIILQLDGITKQFPNTPRPAVSEVSLTLHQGDLLGLLGPSGCGKTTLLRLIAGLEQPQRGVITIDSQPVTGDNWIPPERRGVGMVFQDYALFPHLTVAQNIRFGLRQQKIPSAQVTPRIGEVMELVGLQGFEKRYPHELSGGQQQRVALARALAPNPALVLLDEPLSNLDVQIRLRLRQELRDILKAAGASAVFVTHDQEEALSISDQIGVIRGGNLEQFGPPEAIYRQPATQFVAEFVTQANFLPAKRHGSTWETEIGAFELPSAEVPAANGQSQPPDSNANRLMIRQEDLVLQLDQQGPVVIRDRQFLGREHRYCLKLPSGNELIALTRTDSALAIGSRVQVSVPPDAVQMLPD